MENKINVAFLLGKLEMGGAESLVLNICRKKENVPFNIIVIYRQNGNIKGEFEKTSVFLHKLNFKNKFDFSYVIKLRRLIYSKNINVIHSHQVFDGFVSWLTFRSDKTIKRVHSFHGYSLYKKITPRLLTNFIINRTNSNIYVSNCQYRYYLSKFKIKRKEQQHVIYNGITLTDSNNPPSESIRKELNIPVNDILIGWVGNFTAVRNPIFIVKFIKSLKDNNVTDFQFVFVGKKTEKESHIYETCTSYCKAHHINNVHFLGYRENIPDFLNQLDLFLYSSNHDTFGIAVIEAIAAGIPVFVNDWEVMLEITQNGKLAHIYQTGDFLSLQKLYVDFVKNKTLYKEKAKQSKQQIFKLYDLTEHINNISSLYRKLL